MIADVPKASIEAVEPDSQATTAGVPAAVGKGPNKGEQVPGRKGVSSKLDAIREKYNPAEETMPSPQKWVVP